MTNSRRKGAEGERKVAKYSPRRLVVRISGFQPEDAGSIPAGETTL